MLDEINITEVIVAFLTGGSAVAMIKVLPHLFSLKRPKSEVALDDIAWIYKVMTKARNTLNAKDAWIGRSSNGGGIPRVGHTVYHAFEYQLSDGPELPGPEKKLCVDSGLASFLARAASSRVTIQSAHLFTGSMYELFRSRKVVTIVAFHILTTDKNFFYIGFSFTKAPKMKVGEQAEVLQLAESIKKKMITAKS